jgi:hypothetical protein
MNRPVSVTASAIVAILGSMFALLLAGLMVASSFMELPKPQPPNAAQFAIGGAVMFVALAGLGIWTSVGLFRLRSSARTSILVFAGFLALVSIFSLLIAMAVPMPPNTPAGTGNVFRGVIAVMFGVPFAIAVWWLIQFNTQSTRAAFASPLPETAPRRPISITVIAWMFLVGAASCLTMILVRAPAFFFGAIFNGWIAGLFFALFAALSVYIGKGLLDLRERARIVAIGWFVFSLVQVTIVTLVPALRESMLRLEVEMVRNQQASNDFDPSMLMNVGLALGAIVTVTVIWFLIRNRPAFARTENP